MRDIGSKFECSRPAEGVVPFQRLNVHEHGATGVGDVGDVHLAPGEVPHQPRVDRAKEQPALSCGRRHLGPVIQQPAQLQGGEVRRDGEAAQVLQKVLAAGGARQTIEDCLREWPWMSLGEGKKKLEVNKIFI